MDWKLKILGLFVMMALVVAFIVCWRSETFHRLASPEEKVVITEEMKLCLDCHQEKYTPFVFKSWKKSKHALRGIGCNMCHVTGNNDLKQEIERVAKERGVGESKCEVKKVNHVVPPKVCAQ
ncbi:MAG: multiheme c-type cytochrome, partial [Candidatus Zixiibacteriota bacterium]